MRLIGVVLFILGGVHLACAAEAPAGAASASLNDYPTSARADYVFACMKVNGDTRDALEQCSCSIDVIASLLPYDAYVAASTVASLNQEPGQLGGLFRGATAARDVARPIAARSGGGGSALFLIARRYGVRVSSGSTAGRRILASLEAQCLCLSLSLCRGLAKRRGFPLALGILSG